MLHSRIAHSQPKQYLYTWAISPWYFRRVPELSLRWLDFIHCYSYIFIVYTKDSQSSYPCFLFLGYISNTLNVTLKFFSFYGVLYFWLFLMLVPLVFTKSFFFSLTICGEFCIPSCEAPSSNLFICFNDLSGVYYWTPVLLKVVSFSKSYVSFAWLYIKFVNRSI